MGQLLENTVLGGVMILASALARRLLRRRMNPNAALLLWALCLLRLLTPVPVRSPLSVYGLRAPEQVREAAPAAVFAEGGSAGPAGSPPLCVTAAGEAEGTVGRDADLGAGKISGDLGKSGGFSAGGAIYITVTALLAFLTLRAWLRVRRGVRAAPLASHRPEGALPARARLRVGRVPGAPLTFGVLRPDVVVMPGLRGEKLRYVLAHEAVHVRRGDNLWHYAAALAVCVHWFNPAVWLMASLIRRDVELSCDRAVVAGASGDIRAGYANAVIELSAGGGAAFASGFGRKRTEERIVSIMKYKRTTAAGLLAAVMLVGTLALTLGGSPTEAAEPELLPDEPLTGDPGKADLPEGFCPAWTEGWGEEDPWVYTVRFPEPVAVTDPESGARMEVLSLGVTPEEFIWGWRMDECTEEQRLALENQMKREVEAGAGVRLSDGSSVAGLVATYKVREADGVEYWAGKWSGAVSGGRKAPKTLELGLAESVTVQGTRYPLAEGPASRGAMLWYVCGGEDPRNVKMVAELADGTRVGFTVDYRTETVAAEPLPDRTALKEFGFDPDTWLTGHGPMKAGELTYARAVTVDDRTVGFVHHSPLSWAEFRYDFAAGELTVCGIDGDDPVEW